MLSRKIYLILGLFISLVGLQSCSNNTVNNDTARVQLKLIDAPGDYLEVNIEIVDILFNDSENEGGWKSFELSEGKTYPLMVDLTKLIAGNSLLLTDQIMPAGMLKQIRLVLGENNTLVIDGNENVVHLDTPSAMQSGLKLNIDTELEAGFSYTFILDWDVQKSIVAAGSSNKYNLKPVIKVNTEVNSGAISGSVIQVVDNDEIDQQDISVLLTDGVNEWTTITNEEGKFLFQGIPSGNDIYNLKIEREGFETIELNNISVEVGVITDLGVLELKIIE
ncbi:DUF4382 domain-containing protein [uncultured Lutibacter sp.]|uniref:DUF4382 domain-containing protein n=1 Tax=uncultured Lutibacter sp. TaxID=437739 RepID=UPI0026017B53|nr:DUF4382 domain-containing protein [uncultured Lutibacter sp.]